jgi:hypothetical protein
MITGGHAEEFRLLYLTVQLYSRSLSVTNVHSFPWDGRIKATRAIKLLRESLDLLSINVRI